MTDTKDAQIPGASPRLQGFLSRHQVVRDRARQSVTKLRAALTARGLDASAWAGLLSLEEVWGGLMFSPWPGPPAERLGPALPLFLERAWRDEGRGDSELPASQAPPWPRMRCLGHELWLCGSTSSLDIDYAADAQGRIYRWDREVDELHRLATDGLRALEKRALVDEVERDFGPVPELWVQGLARAPALPRVDEASDAVSTYHRDGNALVCVQPEQDPNDAEVRVRARNPRALVDLASWAATPPAKLILRPRGAAEKFVEALQGAGLGDLQIWP